MAADPSPDFLRQRAHRALFEGDTDRTLRPKLEREHPADAATVAAVLDCFRLLVTSHGDRLPAGTALPLIPLACPRHGCPGQLTVGGRPDAPEVTCPECGRLECCGKYAYD